MQFIKNLPLPDLSVTRGQNRLAWLLIFVFIVFVSLTAQQKTLMADEAKHFRYGMNILNGDSTRFDDSKMPVSALNALPAKLASFLPEGKLRASIEKIFVARFVTILFSALIAFGVFFWSRKLYGAAPAFASLILYLLDPNIIAHSIFVATDVFVTGMILFSTCCLWKFANDKSGRNFILFALALGLSQLAKYTAVSLYPLLFLALFFHDLPQLRKQTRSENVNYLKRFFLWLLLAFAIGLVIINIGFLFNRTFTPFGAYQFRSETFQSLQAALPILRNVPVPAPYPYLEGFDWILQREATGQGYGNLYLLGVVHPVKGFAGYYFIASLLKVPIATQIVILASLVVYFGDKNRRRNLLTHEVFLLLPVLFYTIYFNFFYNAQLGIRFYLVVFPLLYVFAGNLFQNWSGFSRNQRLAVYALGVYLLVSVLSYYPHYIPYFNEFIWDRRTAYKYLADSNIDWEQAQEYLKKYEREHPEAIISPRNKITSGLIVVNANDLAGVTEKPEMYQWLRENFEPVDTIAYGYLVYEITPEQIDHLCAVTDYCR
jgi:4-amino-4-deoxy-L-arabinose transferase-like glycosyltransferase